MYVASKKIVKRVLENPLSTKVRYLRQHIPKKNITVETFPQNMLSKERCPKTSFRKVCMHKKKRTCAPY